MNHTKVNEKTLILCLTLLAFLLRAYRLDFQSYWIDEAWTIHYAHLSLTELWQALQTIRAAPPLYHILTIYWIQWLGDGEYALRFLSLLFSVMAIPLTYRLGRSLGDSRLGLVAALLMAVAPYQVWHGQDARNYSMLTAASLLSMWSFIQLWQQGGRRWQLLYILSTEWAILTHYHGLITIGIQGLFFLLTWPRHGRYYLAWAGTLLVILLPVVVWLFFGSRLWQSEHWLPQVGLGESYLRSALAYSVGELVPRPQAIPLTLAFIFFYGLGLIYAARRRWGSWQGREMVIFLLVYSLAPNLATWLYSQSGTSVYLERYLIPVQASYLLTVAMAPLALFDILSGKWLKSRLQPQKVPLKVRPQSYMSFASALAAIAILVSVSGWVLSHHYGDPTYAKENWRGLIRMIEAFSLPGDAILLTGDGGEKLFDYYYRGPLPVYASFNTPVPPPDEARRRISALAAKHQRLWYTPYGVEIDNLLEDWLAKNSYPAWHSWLGRKRLALYDMQAALTRIEPLDLVFSDSSGQGPTLIQAGLPDIAIDAGDLLPVSLTWQTNVPLPQDYQLSLRLINNRGDLFVQSDWPALIGHQPTSSWPINQAILDQRSLWIPADIPPGIYLLQLVLYRPSSGQSLGQPATIPDIVIHPAKITPPLAALSIPNLIRPNKASLQNTKNPTLVGYTLPGQIQPGQEMWLWLYWQAQAPITDDLTLRLSLYSEGERVSVDYPFTGQVGPLDSWQPGQVRRAVYHLSTSPRLAGETAEVRLALIPALAPAAADTTIANVKLATRARQFELPPVAQPVEVVFDDPPLVKLLGYDLPVDSLTTGDSLPITLYWQAAAEMDVNYTVFVQLLNETGQIVTQVDLQPQAGAAPTTTWLPGEVLADPYSLSLPPDLPAGHYRLIVGLYNAATGRRLPASAGDDFVELGQVAVK